MSNSKELTVELVIDLGSEAGSKVFGVAQQALLQAFQAAGSVDDLAAKLAIPIQLVTVTGAKVIVGNGYDAYKITVAIRSDNPNLVAKELLSTGVGLATTAVTGIGMRMVMPLLSVTGPAGIALSFAGPVVAGWAASNYTGDMWDDAIANTASGQWITGKVADTFGMGLKVTPGSLPAPNVPASITDVPAANQAPRSALVLDPTDNQAKIIFNTSPSRVFDPDVAVDATTYVVQEGESLWSIAQTNGWDWTALKAANPQLTDKNFIRPGQLINGLAPAVIDNPLLNITTTTNPQPSIPGAVDETFGAGQIDLGYLERDSTSSVWMPSDFVNGNGWANQTPGAISSDDYRPGEGSLLTDTLFNLLDPQPVQDFGYTNNSLWGAGWLNNTSQQSFLSTYVDPLVLDLNNDGVKLTDYTSNPVLFDIDNDGGSKEVAGWSSAEDGIVVMDLNGNGRIDTIAETLSEYFNGTAGVGEAGTKPYADGFAALKSLDSNNDNIFNSSDAAFANVKVWVDADHDAETDAGELKTLAALSITQINLDAQTQSGLVRDGNEVLATGSFVQNGVTREALAA